MKGWVLALGLFLACFQSGLAAPPSMTPVSVPYSDVRDREAVGVARMVGNILEYTRWPEAPETLGLCVAGSTTYGSRLDTVSLPDGVPVERRFLAPDAIEVPADCHALYLGNLELAEMRRWTAMVRGAPVVTIAEHDLTCASDAMFCLVFLPDALAFEMNIDAVSRAGVRVDPRVLRLSRGGQTDL